ncbi:MAG: CRTAC1 family protein [Gemmatimonadetes bacterium]|nr:CRTAC1 family protein [Gemmatimonadota bacterium]
MPRWALAAAGVAVALLADGAIGAAARQRAQSPASPTPVFRDVTRQAGLDFIHVNGASEERFLPEITGAGGLFLDFDDDGWLDVFLVDGGSFADPAVARRARHRLYRNRRDGTFEDVTDASDIHHRDYGMGACAGDVDNDGRIDLYITNVGPNVLFRNTGGGRFAEVPGAGGAGSALWSTSCAFVDVDRDGDLDLFVANYLDTSPAKNEFCGFAGPPAMRDYCHPLVYQPLPDVLYRNDGSGAFEDISMQAGIARHRGNGLGVAVSDVDDDGWPDVFVANDSTPNFLFHNNKDGSFAEIAWLAGVAVAADGRPRAGMGTAFGDFSGIGRLGVVVTNHETEMHSLFLNLGGLLFSDVTIPSGVGPATRPYVGFGVVFFDYDNDTRLDLAIVNGNVTANVAQVRARGTLAQRKLLLRNAGERFVDVTKEAGPGFALEGVGRGLAAGDVDNDGDLDLLVANNGDRPNLLLNDGGNAANAVLVRAVGTTSNRSGIGTRLTLTTGERRQVREVQSGSSYLAQNDLRAHFGLGGAERADRLEIRWPDGSTEVVENLPANHLVTLRQGQGIVSRAALTR